MKKETLAVHSKITNPAIRKKTNFKQNDFICSLPLTFLALPGIIYIFIFNYIPLYGLVLPFKDFKFSKGFFGSEWIGLDNFKFLFMGDGVWVATRNTVLYNAVFIILGTAVAISIALMLFEMLDKYVKIYQTFIFLPYFISWVVVAYICRAFLDMDYGMFNGVLKFLGKVAVMWYNEAKYWSVIIVFSNIWKGMGYGALIYYATLMGVNKELFEAAKIDGANKWQQILYISVPALVPMITIMFILNVGKIMYSDFGLFYNLTLNSAILYSTTDVIDTFVYRSLIDIGDIGMSSASGFYQAVLGFILVIISNFIIKKLDEDNALF